MNFEDKVLKAREFDTEILTKLKEICEILYVFRGELMCDSNIFNGHVSYMEIKNDIFTFNITYYSYDAEFNTVTCNIPLKYFSMTKEELVKEKRRLEEKNIIKMYNKKLSDIEQMTEQIEQMREQMHILKAEIVATQEEAEELKKLTEKV